MDLLHILAPRYKPGVTRACLVKDSQREERGHSTRREDDYQCDWYEDNETFQA